MRTKWRQNLEQRAPHERMFTLLFAVYEQRLAESLVFIFSSASLC